VRLERAIDTQRVALLRLLTGLVVALAVVSLAPVASRVPHWVRAYVASVLSRAEIAAGYLLIAAARSVCGVRLPVSAGAGALGCAGFADELSNAAFLRRIRRLQAVLKDLPKRARRLVRRLAGLQCTAPKAGYAVTFEALLAGKPPALSRIERPPDRRRGFARINFSVTPS